MIAAESSLSVLFQVANCGDRDFAVSGREVVPFDVVLADIQAIAVESTAPDGGIVWTSGHASPVLRGSD